MVETDNAHFGVPKEQLDALKLNAFIAALDCVQHPEQPAEFDQAYDMAYAEKPYMDRAVGHLAVAAQARILFFRDKNGPNFMPVFGIVHLLREDNQVRKAERNIRHAYDASANM